MVLYLIAAISGYLSFLDKTPQLIIQRPPLTPSSKDIFMIIGRLTTTFNLITCLPLNINPCRREILSVFFSGGKKKKKPNKVWHTIITIILFWGTAAIGTAVPEVISAFSIIGGALSVFLVIYFPGKQKVLTDAEDNRYAIRETL